MESFDIIMKTFTAIFVGGFVFIIAEIILDERRRRKQIRQGRRFTTGSTGRLPLTDPTGKEIGSVGYIFTKHNGSNTLPKGELLEITNAGSSDNVEAVFVPNKRRGKTILITKEKYEEIKKINREKMRAYRAKKRATLTRTAKKTK